MGGRDLSQPRGQAGLEKLLTTKTENSDVFYRICHECLQECKNQENDSECEGDIIMRITWTKRGLNNLKLIFLNEQRF